MSYAHITIDGDTVLDGQLSQWQRRPPTELAQYLTPDAKRQPGIKALLLALAEAFAGNQDLTANLRNRPTGYDLTVDHGRVIEAST